MSREIDVSGTSRFVARHWVVLVAVVFGFQLVVAEGNPQAPASAPTPASRSVAGEIYKKQSPAVVLIEIYKDKGEVSGSASGFLVSADGKILTNFHVIVHTKQATVRLANKDAYDKVEVLDTDKRKDIALIKIRAVDLPFVTLGKSSEVEVGDKVYSLSNPLGVFENTLSEGIISGIRLGDGYKYFQITAPISHGSSGGPLFNSKGEAIGITSGGFSEGQSLNLAIPIDYARGMLSSNQPQPLSATYEPEPGEESASSEKTAANIIPEDMKKAPLVFLESKLHNWNENDAKKLLGEPIAQRDGSPPAGHITIYAYPDPTKIFVKLELAFNNSTHF